MTLAPPISPTRPDGRVIFLGAMAETTKPRARLSVSQWADANRILSSKGSSESGEWTTARTPYLKEPMDCLSLLSPIRKSY
jgi:phage terminase large subunit GpA-like protein